MDQLKAILKEKGYLLKEELALNKVYVACLSEDNCPYVIKIFEPFSEPSFRNEVAIYKTLEGTEISPHLIEAFEVTLDKWHGVLVLERLDMSLLEIVTAAKEELDDFEFENFYFELEKELDEKLYPKVEQLSELGVINYDLNTGNVVYRIHDDGTREPYIIDYEYSRIDDPKTGEQIEGTCDIVLGEYIFDADDMYNELLYYLRRLFGLTESYDEKVEYSGDEEEFEEDNNEWNE